MSHYSNFSGKNVWHPLDNQRGVALVTSLMLGVFGMLMVLALVYLVSTGTWISGAKVRYQRALDSAYGGIQFFVSEIIQRGIGGATLTSMGAFGNMNVVANISNADFASKLTTTGFVNDPAEDATRPYPDNSLTSNAPNDFADIVATFTMPNGNNITVSNTILSTTRGNSGTSSNLLLSGGVVNNSSGTFTPQHFPYLYQVETRGQGAANENARLSGIYAY